MSYKKKKLNKSRFGRLKLKFGLAKIALWKFAKGVLSKVEKRRKPMFNMQKALEVLKRYDRLPDNPDFSTRKYGRTSDNSTCSNIEKAVLDQLKESGLLRLCVFVCPKFNTKALFSKSPENYMPVEAGPDLFQPRIQKILALKKDLMKAGLLTEINVIIGDNDAEEYIFPFVDSVSLDLNLYKQRQTLYRLSFEQRCRKEFGERCIVWSLAENNVVQDQRCDPMVPMRKELDFFRWLFSEDGPYRGTLNFPIEILVQMVKMKYRLYGAQGNFLEILGGILLQTEGPGVWLERTSMLKTTGSPAIPAIYPWIRKDEGYE